MTEEYPSNSNNKRAGKPRVPTRDKHPASEEVIDGTIVDADRVVERANVAPRVRKEGLIQRTAKSIFGAEPDGVVSYILWDVLIPAAKETVQDMVTQGIEMFLFPDSAGRRRSSRNYGGRKGIVSYGNLYRNDNTTPPWRRQSSRPQQRSSRSYSNKPRRSSGGQKSRLQAVVFETASEAQEVLSIMGDILEQYGEVTVADFYDVAGLQNHAQATDNAWGWRTLANTNITRTRDGFEIDFPRTQQTEL